MPVRKIVCIDEDKCDGCGVCVPSCAEGAIQVIDGKARLVSDIYCDGLGACLGECPRDAITIEEREAPEFDEIAAMKHVARTQPKPPVHACPSARLMSFGHPVSPAPEEHKSPAAPEASALGHWPVQLTLVPPHAPFLKNADILLTADCVPFAYPNFHRDFLKDKALLIACPKLDDYEAHLHKLSQIFAQAQPDSVTVLRMEVPCCGGLTQLVRQAAQMAGVMMPVSEVTIGIRGQVLAAT
ncbi:4Fe-4S ferredoxin [Dehalogenimonas sp. THU2]|uniref:ATP-binding protein n=1 Tax=Dehalogenimonas sp. THU2 TaxID=3151121 RepID=UPI003218181F